MSTKYALSSTGVEQEPVTCPFCLNDLLRGQPSPGIDEDVACLNPCRHAMHSECLQFWVVRANTCPLCHGKFNEFSVSKTVDSDVIRTHIVEDKRQGVHQFVDDHDHWAGARGRRQQAAVVLHEPPRAECNHCHLPDRGEPILCGQCARFYHVESLEPRRPAAVVICRSCALREERALMDNGNPFRHNLDLQTRPLSRAQLARLVGQDQLHAEPAGGSAAEHREPVNGSQDESEDDIQVTFSTTASIVTQAKRRQTVPSALNGGSRTVVPPVAWGEPIRRIRTAWPQGPEVISEEEGELWRSFELALKESQDGRI